MSASTVGINIGATREAAQEVRRAIMEILNAPYADQLTKQEAIKALSSALSVNNASITGCSVAMNPGKNR